MVRVGRRALDSGHDLVEAFSPYPVPEIEELLFKGESRVRIFTLLGGILGCVAGFGLTVGIALRHGIVTGGKPIVAIPPFLIIAFELTVLFGALATMAGFMIQGGLPHRRRGRPHPTRCTADGFGLTIACSKENAETLRGELRDAGALEVIDESD
jgi:hypothetical protein